jgi:hypothetical protein
VPVTPSLISGIVSDVSGRPLAGARVSFTAGPVSLPDIAALTDSRGSFTLTAPAPGSYEIEAVAEGFVSKRVSVAVSAGRPARVELVLDKE